MELNSVVLLVGSSCTEVVLNGIPVFPERFNPSCHWRYGKAATPHATRSPWKYSCVLRHHATSILIQERCSSFVIMALALSPRKSTSYTLQYIERALWPLAALTHLTVLVHVHKTGISRTRHRHRHVQGRRYRGGLGGLNPPPDINNKSLIKIKFLSILVDV